MSVKAILSTTLLQAAGDYRFQPLTEMPNITGIAHFVGHPATRYLLDAAQANYTPGYFTDALEIGDSFYVAQLKDPRKGQAFTVDHPGVTDADLKWSLVTRIA